MNPAENLGSGFSFSDASLSSASAMGGSGVSIRVIISPKEGHGNDAVAELGGHYVMMNTLFIGAERDALLTGNDFRNIAIAVAPVGQPLLLTDSRDALSLVLKCFWPRAHSPEASEFAGRVDHHHAVVAGLGKAARDAS